MHFNVRLFNFPNGEKQVRFYSVSQFIPDELPQALDIENSIKKRKDYELNHSQEPFTNKWVKEVDYFEDVLKDKPDLMRSMYSSLNRSKNNIYMLARCEKWEWFVTWTLSPEKKDRYDYEKCSKAVRKWLNHQRERFAPALKYLIVPERHKDGAWHFHGLLCNVGNMCFSPSGCKDKKGHVIYNLPSYTLGFTTATRVKDYYKVAKYLGKYITKDLTRILKGKQRYYASRNITKPDSSVFCVPLNEEEIFEFVETLASSYGKEVKHVKSVGNEKSYTKVTYFELQ